MSEVSRPDVHAIKAAILETLMRQASTTEEGRRLMAAQTDSPSMDGETHAERKVEAEAIMRGLMNACAGNLAQIVDEWIDEAIEQQRLGAEDREALGWLRHDLVNSTASERPRDCPCRSCTRHHRALALLDRLIVAP